MNNYCFDNNKYWKYYYYNIIIYLKVYYLFMLINICQTIDLLNFQLGTATIIITLIDIPNKWF